MYRALAFVIAFFCFTMKPCDAQSSDSSSQPQTPTAAPQSSSAAPQASASSDATALPKKASKKPKKIWTNDEIISLGGKISVVGNSVPSPAKVSVGSNGDNSQKAYLIANYRQQVLQLRAEMDRIDKQIAGFENYKPNTSTGGSGMDPRLRYSTTSPEESVKQLEEKKKQLQAKIDAIEEAARKEGIEPGQLR